MLDNTTLFTIRPTIIVPYGRGAKISIDADGVITRTVPTFGSSPGVTDGAYADSTFDYAEDLAAICAEITASEKTSASVSNNVPRGANAEETERYFPVTCRTS